MAAVPLYCVCRQPYDVSRFMIECDICKDWFHGSCVQVEEHHAVDIDVYHCPNCDVLHGPSLMKKRNNWHRHDYTEPNDGTRPVQAGTSVFVRQLQERTFPSGDEILVRMQGHQVTQRYLEKHGFHNPITVSKLEGLGLRLPSSTFSVSDVERYVGGDKIIDVIDVARQADSKIKLGEFVKYFYSLNRPKVLNVISLEFSDTKMSELVEVPDIAQKMSWVENYWPDDSFFPKPFVQKYCLMGVKDSYTDFHIDFGGTSVWYHVLWGEKIFYMIKPTPENLALYEAWSSSPNQSEVFFGEKVDNCYKCVVPQGTTVLIPTGWIHAVLTSQDCMAFGGNFLHNLNIGMQLRCYEMERRLKTPDLFKFPYFEAICWYVAKNLLESLKELREDNCQPAAYLVEGVKALISALKIWLKREVTEPASEIPDNIRPNHLIKELAKEVRYQEEEQVGGLAVGKPVKTQGSGAFPVTRSTGERGSRARRTARRLRDPLAHQSPSSLDILELHTLEVLRRLEAEPFEEDAAFSSQVNGKFNKASTASTAAVHSSLDNNLRLVLCNGRIMRDERKYLLKKRSVLQSTEQGVIRVEDRELGQDHPSTVSKAERLGPINAFLESMKSELRTEATRHCDISDLVSQGSCTTRKKGSSEEFSGSSEEEEGDEVSSSRSEDVLRRQRPTSPSTEEAIQGMLSMAGLLCPSRTEENGNKRKPWWASPDHHSQDSDGEGESSGEESQGDSDSNSSLSHQDKHRTQNHLGKECPVQLSLCIQENKNFMELQSGSDAWPSHRLSLDTEADYTYTDTSLSPPLHPCKRPASNPPPVSNQATKGKRPKKGMATAKQRLGKILKLNRQNRFFV